MEEDFVFSTLYLAKADYSFSYKNRLYSLLTACTRLPNKFCIFCCYKGRTIFCIVADHKTEEKDKRLQRTVVTTTIIATWK